MRGFSEQLCSEITVEFNDCSKQVLMQVLEMESLFLNPDYCRVDLAELLRAIQTQELHLTATIQRVVNHENCSFKMPMEHECVHLQEITEAAGTKEAEANAEGVQETVTAINEHLEEVRYEIAALEIE
uniref:Uncharacterized protein n=1 Tax=Gossypium raimondii TaxID=29730 RepID=A0A0D2UFZ4_GOSRA|nr:hypothetical protein B456_010G208600 [Gossypium raimondii]